MGGKGGMKRHGLTRSDGSSCEVYLTGNCSGEERAGAEEWDAQTLAGL